MTIDATTGVLTWTPTSRQLVQHYVTVMVSDGDKQITQSFTIKVYPSQVAASAPIKVYATAYTYQTQDWSMLQNKLNQLKDEGKIRDSAHFSQLPAAPKGITQYDIEVYWHSYPNTTGYNVYRSVNGDEYRLIYQGKPEYDSYYLCGIYDEEVSNNVHGSRKDLLPVISPTDLSYHEKAICILRIHGNGK